jgi:hypothetical protein
MLMILFCGLAPAPASFNLPLSFDSENLSEYCHLMIIPSFPPEIIYPAKSLLLEYKVLTLP